MAVHAITEAQVWGKPVVILGVGPIGAMAVAVASKMGATRVFATSRTPAKLQIAQQMGATRVFNPLVEDVVREVLDETDGAGVGAVIDFTGDSAAVDQGFRMLRKGGRVVFVAAIAGPVVMDMRQHMVWKEAKVSGIHGRRMFETWNLAEDLVCSGKVSLDLVMGETYGLSDFRAAFDAAGSGSIGRVFLKP
ncbi:MAG: zinc-binding dehydrogenase [Chloroflexota bacterium]